jgi:hypothetical protein
MDYYFNPSVRCLYIRTEVAATNLKSTVQSCYKYNNYSPAELEYTYRFSGWHFSFVPQLHDNLYNKAGFQWHIGAGGSFNYLYARGNSLHKQERSQTTNNEETKQAYFLLNTTTLNTVFATGIQIRQWTSLSFIWGNAAELTSFVSGPSARSGLFAFSAAYALRK